MRFLFVLLALSMTLPAAAQDAEPEPVPVPEQGIDLMGEALKLFMRGLMQEMEPAIDDLSGFLDNLDAYHAPEVLPNGDILIRRKTPVEESIEGAEEGEIEL
ncbi:hypothetical protein EF888_16380 [Silicimonas algicola]|uniref:AAA+ family ATPase n=1 Tax=Silicimonas algicola TaxID=1826607 RepID=A0A316G447_9RHOB|nr:hypothetical protein [Silicimonas algicola]AZQ68571.1 hypothetical protein EF888_16380 [Silicimonas algicola]PWK55714.1 hypothetical protein C8D95_106110 [Silicimonas algicola]